MKKIITLVVAFIVFTSFVVVSQIDAQETSILESTKTLLKSLQVQLAQLKASIKKMNIDQNNETNSTQNQNTSDSDDGSTDDTPSIHFIGTGRHYEPSDVHYPSSVTHLASTDWHDGITFTHTQPSTTHRSDTLRHIKSTMTHAPDSYTHMPGSNRTSEERKKPIFRRLFVEGTTGDDVKNLQLFLNTNENTRVADTGPGSPGQETSYYGQLTQDAVRRLQKLVGISQTGVFDTETRDTVNNIIETVYIYPEHL